MVARKRLYPYSVIDHEALFGLASGLQGDFLMTYDDDAEVQELANRYEFDMNLIAMKNTHHARKTELLIGQDLGWLKMRSPC